MLSLNLKQPGLHRTDQVYANPRPVCRRDMHYSPYPLFVVLVVFGSFAGLANLSAQTVSSSDEFRPEEEYRKLTPEQRQNLSRHVDELKDLSKNQMAEADSMDLTLDEPMDCGVGKTKRECLKSKIEVLAASGADVSELQARLGLPATLRRNAQDVGQVADVADKLQRKQSLGDSLKNDGTTIYGTFRDSWKYLIEKEALIAVTAGMAGYFAVKNVNEKTTARYTDPQYKWGGLKYSLGDNLGQGYTIVVPVWLIGKLTDNEKLTRLSDDWIAGGIIDGLIITGLKYAVREQRPDQSDNLGFPSGHTSTAFMMATVVQEELGWKWGAPAYVLATYVGLSRIGGAKHTPGQVLAGAGIGYAVGWAAAQASAENQAKRNSATSGKFNVGDTRVYYQAAPAILPHYTGFMLDFRW